MPKQRYWNCLWNSKLTCYYFSLSLKLMKLFKYLSCYKVSRMENEFFIGSFSKISIYNSVLTKYISVDYYSLNKKVYKWLNDFFMIVLFFTIFVVFFVYWEFLIVRIIGNLLALFLILIIHYKINYQIIKRFLL